MSMPNTRAGKIKVVVTVYNKPIKYHTLFYHIVYNKRSMELFSKGVPSQCLFFVIDAPCMMCFTIIDVSHIKA